MKPLTACLAFLVLCGVATPTLAGKNAGGALIVHTNDAYTYSSGTACTTPYAIPTSCEEAITRSDKSEGTVAWFLAAFPDTSNPAVTVVYFGVDYDDANLDPGSAYRLCGPPGSFEVPDDDWPYTGRGNSIAFGTPVTQLHVFPVYVIRIDGGQAGSYFRTRNNPTGGYAAFVDDSDPPCEDAILRFGQLSWFGQGWNECPGSEPGEVLDEEAPWSLNDWSPFLSTGTVKGVIR